MEFETSQKPRQADFFNVCGNCPISCCREARPPLTVRRKEIIQDFLKMNNLSVPKPFENRSYSFPRETEEGYCVFLDKSTKKCRVHSAKPETCVAGPITFDLNLQTGRIEWFIKTEKICPLAGALYRDKEALEEHVKSAKKEILELVRALDKEALRTILSIEEPETFKIDEDDTSFEIAQKLKS